MGMVFCRGCGKEISESAPTCPHCGEQQTLSNKTNSMTGDTKVMLLIESKKKSGWIAAILNWFIPGVGYMYCGRVILGIIVLLITVVVAVKAILGLFIIIPVVVIDGFLSASRYNKKMIAEVISNSN
jgi:TM2 domain-containing membrane protein YozV